MWVRSQLDLSWFDVARAIRNWIRHSPPEAIPTDLERMWSPSGDALICRSVRTGLDLLLSALRLPPKSEVLVTAITIESIVHIIEWHGLVPVPVDVDMDHLGPKVSCLRTAISSRTRVLVIAHLFGSLAPLDRILAEAHQHGLIVVEDCAQAFTGPDYTGHPAVDVSLFSFGPLKTCTALGGALVRVRDPELLEEMRRRQACYPVQTRWSYPCVKYAIVKGLSSRLLYGLFVSVCRVLRYDYDEIVNSAALQFSGARLIAEIRQRPCAALVAMLSWRLRRFDETVIAKRAASGKRLRTLLGKTIRCPGDQAPVHTYWLFPVVVERPERVIEQLRRRGFDAMRGHSLIVVPPPDCRDPVPREAIELLKRIVFIPFYAGMPDCVLERLAKILVRAVRMSSNTTDNGQKDQRTKRDSHLFSDFPASEG